MQLQMVRLRLLHPRLFLSSAAVAARHWTPSRRLLSTQHVQSATSSIAGDAKPFVPLRKQLKDETKAKRLQGKGKKKSRGASSQVEGWELTVGIEVHAQLDTDSKLFSSELMAIKKHWHKRKIEGKKVSRMKNAELIV